MRPVVIAVLVGLLGASAATGQDRVVLKSGRELLGEVVAETGGEVLVDDVELGPLLVPRVHVRAVLRAGIDPGIYGLVAAVPSGSPPEAHLRFLPPGKEGAGRLQTATSRWYVPATDTTLFLVGVVHVGDPAYYARVQDVLDGCDAVLFEGIGTGAQAADEVDLARFDVLFQLQLRLKDLLGLEFQKEGLAYGRPFWKNADVDAGALNEELERRGVALPTDHPLVRGMLRLLLGTLDLADVQPDPMLQRTLRRRVAPLLAGADSLLADRSLKGLQEVLVEFRNEAVVAALEAELDAGPGGRWIGLLYGAGHLADLERRFGARGWQWRGTAWETAWIVD